MLLQRILTSLAIVLAVGSIIYFLTGPVFATVVTLIAALATYEWAGFMRLQSVLAKTVYVLGFLIFAWIVLAGGVWSDGVYLGLLGYWLIALILMGFYPKGAALVRQPILLGLAGYIVLLGVVFSVVSIRNTEAGVILLYWLIVITAATDVGAYFAGRALGSHRLAPALSPGKTWEGALGGGVLALSLGLTGAVWLLQIQPTFAAVLIILLIGLAILGDLFESLIKRATGIKDSGRLLPGHGGILDRIDSLLMTSPLAAWVLT
tara:strand:+ start:7516 stop:8304 length:789 start_codon:yes stop_codon:yes gene_type:complete